MHIFFAQKKPQQKMVKVSPSKDFPGTGVSAAALGAVATKLQNQSVDKTKKEAKKRPRLIPSKDPEFDYEVEGSADDPDNPIKHKSRFGEDFEIETSGTINISNYFVLIRKI